MFMKQNWWVGVFKKASRVRKVCAATCVYAEDQTNAYLWISQKTFDLNPRPFLYMKHF